ncbi:MAG: FtsK/SpoIIIE domain-containing protein [Acidimicrobiaceae bacterium]|nr:FtsK/SpoIIIE domain-containing protein [Acidimicrobiaceae bacterium]
MRLRYRLNAEIEFIVELSGRLDSSTVDDLAKELNRVVDVCGDTTTDTHTDNTTGLKIDGCWYKPDVPLSSIGFWEGTSLEITEISGCKPSMSPFSLTCDAEETEHGTWRVSAHSKADPIHYTADFVIVVTGGLNAGLIFDLGKCEQPYIIGRAASCDVIIDDLTVSRRHARVAAYHDGRPVIDDLRSRNGVVVGGQITAGPTLISKGTCVRLGAACLDWRCLVTDTPSAVATGLGATDGRIPFNRPPRSQPSFEPVMLRVPAEPSTQSEVEPLSWIGVILPVITGLVLALIWSPFMAVFAVLGPLLTIGTWFERRRRNNRKYQNACEDVTAEVEKLKLFLPVIRAAERKRRVSLVPDLAEIVRRACTHSVCCWERRLDDPDAMKLGIGTADVHWKPSLEIVSASTATSAGNHEAVMANEARDVLAQAGTLQDVPLVVSLKAGEILGIVGPSGVARSIARSLILQAAVLHGPADLAIACLAPSYDDGANSRASTHTCGSTSFQSNAETAYYCSSSSQSKTHSKSPWLWLHWLAHTAYAGQSGALIALDGLSMSKVVTILQSDTSKRLRLLIVDGAGPLSGSSAPARVLPALELMSAIVMVSNAHDLPASCTTVVEVQHSAGSLRLLKPRLGLRFEPVCAWGANLETVTTAAARLARLEDPELNSADSELSADVALVDLIGFKITPDNVLKNWKETRATGGLSTPIGVDAGGILEIDLIDDGPHVLIGGTTGSGKSELLRSLVAGLALSVDPEGLAFVLIDYKGGAAFDRCSDMPHVCGMVTDLDDHLAERALQCLEAELRYREKRLRTVGAESLVDYQVRLKVAKDQTIATFDEVADVDDPMPRSGRQPLRAAETLGEVADVDDPMPRLVVVVDEFATLASDLPEFLDSLVSIAQRGRSLGVHIVLATQRPAGVITEDIRANTSCRIALRVTDKHDSNDVIGLPNAADIPRDKPGRALAYFGAGQLVAFQTALVTGKTPPASSGLQLTVITQHTRKNTIGDNRKSASDGCTNYFDGCVNDCGDNTTTGVMGCLKCSDNTDTLNDLPNDLDRVVDAVQTAHKLYGGDLPRSLWLPPLPEEIDYKSLQGSNSGAAWLVDDPAHQRQFTGGWQPEDGHLVVVGGPVSGTSTTLLTVAMDLCRSKTPNQLHLYGIDFDGGALSVLEGLPHTGSIVHRSDSERRNRLLRFLDNEVASRRASDIRQASDISCDNSETAADKSTFNDVSGKDSCGTSQHTKNQWPSVVLLVDDLAGLARSHDLIRESELHQQFARIWSSGMAVDVNVVVSIRRPNDLPPDLAALAGVVLVHSTSDIDSGLRFGLKGSTSGFCPGRAVRAHDGLQMQVARPTNGDFTVAVNEIAATFAKSRRSVANEPVSIGVLPEVVSAETLPVGVSLGERFIDIRFAMSDLTLDPVGFALHNSEHAIVLGPSRSGRTMALAAIGAAVRQAGIEVFVVTNGRNSDLADRLEVSACEVSEIRGCTQVAGQKRRFFLMDNAHLLEDEGDILIKTIKNADWQNHLIVATAPERLRSAYGHWLTELRSCRTGVLFQPGPLDGDLLGATLPHNLDRRAPRPGCGWIVTNGRAVKSRVAFVA